MWLVAWYVPPSMRLGMCEDIFEAKLSILHPKLYDWVVVSNIFNFHPYLGKISILTNIFQMGWKPPTSYCI